MKFSHLLLCAASLGALSACDGGVKETLGLSRQAPDEFRVVARPPLSVPPDFSLRPPAEGNSVSGSDVPASKQARELVMGEQDSGGLRPGSASTAVTGVKVSDAGTPSGSNGDASFLRKAGAAQADASIRDKLRADYGDNVDPSEKSMLDKIREPGHNEPLVDAPKEKERLSENKETGKPVTEGETPTVQPRNKGWLSKIF